MTSIEMFDLCIPGVLKALIVNHNSIKTLPRNCQLVKNSCATLLERGGLDLQNWGAPILDPDLNENACFNGAWGNFGPQILQIQPPHVANPHVELSGKRFWFKTLFGGVFPP